MTAADSVNDVILCNAITNVSLKYIMCVTFFYFVSVGPDPNLAYTPSGPKV